MQEPIIGREQKILVIPSCHQYLARILDRQTEKRIEHFHAIGTTIGVIAQEHQIATATLEAKALHAAVFVEPLEHTYERADVPVKITVKNKLGTGLSCDPLRKRLEWGGWSSEITPRRIKKLVLLGRRSHPVFRLTK